MNAKELVIAIKSLFDPKGTEDARRQLAATGSAAGKASQNISSAGSSSGNTAAKMQQAAGAASALAGALGQGQGGLATAARTAGGALASLRAGWIGIAIAIITVAVAAIDYFKSKSEKALQKLQDQHDAFHRGLKRSADLKLDNMVKQYKDAADAAGKAADAAERLLEAGRRLADARNERALAELDAEEAEALNKVDPQDEIAVERVKLDYANKREEIQTRSAIADARDNRDLAKNKLKAGEAAEIKAMNDIRALKQLRDQNPSENNKKAVDSAQSELDAISKGVAISRIDVQTANERVGAAYAKRRSSQASLTGRAGDLDIKDSAARSAADDEADQRARLTQERDSILMRRYQAESDVETAARAVRPTNKLGSGSGQDALARAEAAAAESIPNLNSRLDALTKMLEQLNSRQTNARSSD